MEPEPASFTPAVWRVPGGRVLHRRIRNAKGGLTTETLCGRTGPERGWSRWQGGGPSALPECGKCKRLAGAER